VKELETKRLLLRQWRDSDRVVFAEMNDDPEVMRYFPKRLTRAESDALADLISERIEEAGWGLWAVEVRESGAFIGFVGLSNPDWRSGVEVGWRLARSSWGRGYAPEAGRASLRYGFETLELDEIISMTVPANARSQKVMHKLGMIRDPSRDFEHPRVPEGHALRPHVLYTMSLEQWQPFSVISR